ncbi:MAG: hypothetical protein KAJ07_12135, partial [Planctomycetes bacterium]|nr:hypothetical protein [Planctomycetota bacterium]
IKTGGTFNGGTGTIVFAGYNSTFDVDTSETLYNVTINKTYGFEDTLTISSGDIMVVDGTLTLTDGRVAGIIDAQGDINQGSAFNGGTARLNFADDGTAQTYTIAGGIGPHLYLDSASDANDSVVFNAGGGLDGLTLTSDFSGTNDFIYNGNDMILSSGGFNQAGGIFIAPAAALYLGTVGGGETSDFTKTGGIFDEGTGTIVFAGHNSAFNVDTSETLYNVTINKTYDLSDNLLIASGDTMVVAGTLTLTDGDVGVGTIDALGDINQGSAFNAGGGGSARLNFANDGVAQTYTIEGGTGPHLYLDSASDASDSIVFNAGGGLDGLTLTSDFSGTANFIYNGNDMILSSGGFSQAGGIFIAPATLYLGTVLSASASNFTKTGGIFDEGTGTILFAGWNNAFNVDVSETFYNVEVNKTDGFYNRVNMSLGDTMVVAGTLTLTDGRVFTGTIDAQGDIIVGAAFNQGTANITLSGTNAQTLTLNADAFPTGVFTVNKPWNIAVTSGTLTLTEAVIVREGTLSLGGNTTFNGGITVESGGMLSCTTEGTIITIDDEDIVTVDLGGILVLRGVSDNLVVLQSDTTFAWDLVMNGIHDIDYVDASYSDASGGSAIYAENSLNSGNNINWIFNSGSAPVITSTIPDITTPENTPEVRDLTGYESDAEDGPAGDGNNLTWAIFGVAETLFTASIDLAADELTIMPELDTSGSGVVALILTDSDGLAAVQNITVTIGNTAPEITPVVTDIKTLENTPVTIDLSGNKQDAEDAPAALIWSVSGADETLFTASIDADTLTIDPVENASGIGTITLTLTDSGELTDTQDVQITVQE